MRVLNETIIKGDKLFVLKEERFQYNDFPLHIHPEYEIILVLKSSGKRYVGDSIDAFSPGDLCLFGPNLPHTFYNKHLPADREVHQIVIQFKKDFLGQDFFDKPQFDSINDLFRRSLHGLCFTGETRENAKEKMQQMLHADEAEAAASLIILLNMLGRSKEFILLSRSGLTTSDILKETERMSRVYHYLLDNFRRDISLDEIASIAHLSNAAFCRYFKKHTRKTFSEFVNDLRINYAIKLLQQNHLSVMQVCYESGYNNLSYFNRQFKSLMSISPLQYQKRHRNGVHPPC